MELRNNNFNQFYSFIQFCKNNQFRFNPFLTESIDNTIDFYKNGNKIKIKKKNRGKFTKSANQSGMGVQEFASHVLSNKDKYSTTQIRRANFARNASKWKHKK